MKGKLRAVILIITFLLVIIGCRNEIAVDNVDNLDKEESRTNIHNEDMSSKIDSNEQEVNKTESSKQESSKQESSKQESSKQESSKQESSKQESSKQESSKQESSKQESSKQESSKQESSKQESSKQESSKQESSKEEDNDKQPLPWDDNGRLPYDYSWEEYLALNEEEQEIFFEWFEASAEFEEWMNSVRKDDSSEDMPVYPWENGGKKPNEYTWDEFQTLNPEEQEAFFEWFDSPAAFEEWMNSVQNNSTEDAPTYPWENGGKQPNEYTWDEFQALKAEEQEAFFEWFESPEAFEAWMNSAQNNSTEDAPTYPWENGGKQPNEYTWDEFQALEEEEQEAFFEWFDSPEDFESWMNSTT